MPKVILGQWTEKNIDFVKRMKSCMVLSGKKYMDMAKRAGITQDTFYRHCREPDKMTVKELRAYVQEAKIPEEYIINFIFQSRKS